MPRKLTRPEIRTLASEAYAYGLDAGPDTYNRGYAAGVEDLALMLTTDDPAISERLITIVKAAGFRDALGPTSRIGA
jgi:hypothetical protein